MPHLINSNIIKGVLTNCEGNITKLLELTRFGGNAIRTCRMNKMHCFNYTGYKPVAVISRLISGRGTCSSMKGLYHFLLWLRLSFILLLGSPVKNTTVCRMKTSDESRNFFCHFFFFCFKVSFIRLNFQFKYRDDGIRPNNRQKSKPAGACKRNVSKCKC